MLFVVAKLEILEIHTGSIERALTLQKSFKLDAQFHGFQITRQYHPLRKYPTAYAQEFLKVTPKGNQYQHLLCKSDRDLKKGI